MMSISTWLAINNTDVRYATEIYEDCSKTRNAGTRNSGIQKNKSVMVKRRTTEIGTVKRGTTSSVRLNADCLHLNLIFSDAYQKEYIFFTPVEGFSNKGKEIIYHVIHYLNLFIYYLFTI